MKITTFVIKIWINYHNESKCISVNISVQCVLSTIESEVARVALAVLNLNLPLNAHALHAARNASHFSFFRHYYLKEKLSSTTHY